jgi:hypothetical protein
MGVSLTFAASCKQAAAINGMSSGVSAPVNLKQTAHNQNKSGTGQELTMISNVVSKLLR